MLAIQVFVHTWNQQSASTFDQPHFSQRVQPRTALISEGSFLQITLDSPSFCSQICILSISLSEGLHRPISSDMAGSTPSQTAANAPISARETLTVNPYASIFVSARLRFNLRRRFCSVRSNFAFRCVARSYRAWGSTPSSSRSRT
jgi:hypothetical protein